MNRNQTGINSESIPCSKELIRFHDCMAKNGKFAGFAAVLYRTDANSWLLDRDTNVKVYNEACIFTAVPKEAKQSLG